MLHQQFDQILLLIQLVYLDALVVQLLGQQYLIGEPLIDQTFLPHATIHQLLGAHTHQCIEKSIELVGRVLLGTHDAPHALDLLSPGFEMHAHLNAYVCTRQIDGCVPYSA